MTFIPDPNSPARRAWPMLLALLALVAISFPLDHAAYTSLAITDRARLALIESKDWYRLFRVAGFWPTWFLVSVAIALADAAQRRPNWLRRGVFLTLATAEAGLLAELIKFPVGRMRPEDTAGVAWLFKPLAERAAHWSNLSMPSSHAAVAFAAAFGVGALWRGTGPAMLLLAAGCAATRLIAGAHFLSDVAAGALIGWLCTETVRRLDARNNAGRPIGDPGA